MKNVYLSALLAVTVSAAYAQTVSYSDQHLTAGKRDLIASVNNTPVNDQSAWTSARDLAMPAVVFHPELFTVVPDSGGISTVRINKELHNAQVWVYDMMGNCLLNQHIDADDGKFDLTISPGRYFMIVKNGRECRSCQLQVE
jgi:hypothetical protein